MAMAMYTSVATRQIGKDMTAQTRMVAREGRHSETAPSGRTGTTSAES
jgi:hypothetical protein